MESSCCGYKPGPALEMAGLSSCLYRVQPYTSFHQQKVKRSRYDSPLRSTASVQIRKTDAVQRWGQLETRECVSVLVLMYMHAFLLPSSPLSWIFLSAVLSLKPRTFSTVRNCSTPELHPKQCPLFPTFHRITMDTTHEFCCFIGNLRGKPSIVLTMRTRRVTEGKSLNGLPSLHSSPTAIRKPLYLCWPKKVLVGNSAH